MNYGLVLVAGLTGVAAGGAGMAAGRLVVGGSKLAAAARGAVAGGVENITAGAVDRAARGQDVFNPAAMATDLLTGVGQGRSAPTRREDGAG